MMNKEIVFVTTNKGKTASDKRYPKVNGKH